MPRVGKEGNTITVAVGGTAPKVITQLPARLVQVAKAPRAGDLEAPQHVGGPLLQGGVLGLLLLSEGELPDLGRDEGARGVVRGGRVLAPLGRVAVAEGAVRVGRDDRKLAHHVRRQLRHVGGVGALGPARVAGVDAADEVELLQGEGGRGLVVEVDQVRGAVVEVLLVALARHVEVEERAEDLLVDVERVGVPPVGDVQGGEQVVQVHRGGVQQAPGAAQVVRHGLGQGDGLLALVAHEEDLHQAATHGDNGGGRPGGLDDTGLPQLGEQPLEVLVVLLLAHEADEAVQLRGLELEQVDVHALAGGKGLAQDGLGQLQQAALEDSVRRLVAVDTQACQLEGEGDQLGVLEAVLAGHELEPGRGQANSLDILLSQEKIVDPPGDGGAGDVDKVILVETQQAKFLDYGNDEGTSDGSLGLEGGTELLCEEAEDDELLGMLLLVDPQEDVQTSTIEQLLLQGQYLAGDRQAVAVVQNALSEQVGHDVGEGNLDDALIRLCADVAEGLLESSNKHHGAAVNVVVQLEVRGILEGDGGASDLVAGNNVEPQLLEQSPGLAGEAVKDVGLGESDTGLVELLLPCLLAGLRLVRAGPDADERGQAGESKLVEEAVLLLVDLELLPPESLGLLGGLGAHSTLGLATSTRGLCCVQSREVALGGSKESNLERRSLDLDRFLVALRRHSLLLLGVGDDVFADLDSLLLVLHVGALAGDGDDGHGGRQGNVSLRTVDLGASIAVLDGHIADLLDRDLEVNLEDGVVPLIDGLHEFWRHVVLLGLLGEGEPQGVIDRAELGPALLLVVDLGESDGSREGILADDTLGVLVSLEQLEVVTVGALDVVLHGEVTHGVECPNGERIAGSQRGLVAFKELLVHTEDLEPLVVLLVELDKLVRSLGDKVVLDLQARAQRSLEYGHVQLLGRLVLVGLRVGLGEPTCKLDGIGAVCLGEAVLARTSKLGPQQLEQLGQDFNGLSPLVLGDVEAGQRVAGLDLGFNGRDLPVLASGLRIGGVRSVAPHNVAQNAISLGVVAVVFLASLKIRLGRNGSGRVVGTTFLELLADLVKLLDNGLRLLLGHVLVVEPDTVENVLGLGVTTLATQEASVSNANLDLALMGLGELGGLSSAIGAAAVLVQTAPERDIELLSMGEVLQVLVRVRHTQGNLNTTDVKDIQFALGSLEDGLGILYNLFGLVRLVQHSLELHSSLSSLFRVLALVGYGRLVDITVHSLGLGDLLDADIQLGQLVVIFGSKRAWGTTLRLGLDEVLEKLLTLSDSLIASSGLLLSLARDLEGPDCGCNSKLVVATQNSLSNPGGNVEVLGCLSKLRKLVGKHVPRVSGACQRLPVPGPLLQTNQEGRVREVALEFGNDLGSLDLTVRVEAGVSEVRQPVASGVLKQSVRLEEGSGLMGGDGVQAGLHVPRDADLDVEQETGSQVLVGFVDGEESSLALLLLLLAELQKVQTNELVTQANSLVLNGNQRSYGLPDIVNDGSLGDKQPADYQASVTTERDSVDMSCKNLVLGGRQLVDGKDYLVDCLGVGQEPKRQISPGQRALAADSDLLGDLIDLLLVTNIATGEPAANQVLHILGSALRCHGDLASGLGPGLGEGTAEDDDADIVLVRGGDVMEVLEGLKLVGLVTLESIQAIYDQNNILETLEGSVKGVPERILGILRVISVRIKLCHVGEVSEQGDVAHILLKQLQQEGLDQSDLRGLGGNLAIDRRRNSLVLIKTGSALQSLDDPVK
ncbi:hypothetical protein VPNG_02701 [Cytospora leucostoma]|uniref:Uncharacterized protein n=1 Tax=Cytospora leucostoma TaxID=1230097 RepID=A0A423XIW9_9PEZI|nr:hypothetical protein VPNG_02701 [Cytospora leucostoma]